MTNAIYFFATRADILPVLEAIEATRALKYVEIGSFTVANAFFVSRAVDLPDLGIASAGDRNHTPHFMIMPWDTEITCRIVPQRRDGVRYIFSHHCHPDSITFIAGGRFASEAIIAGEFGTVFETDPSQELFRCARTRICKSFRRVKSYWVGSEASRLWKSGWRLTASVGAPATYDLAE